MTVVLLVHPSMVRAVKAAIPRLTKDGVDVECDVQGSVLVPEWQGLLIVDGEYVDSFDLGV